MKNVLSHRVSTTDGTNNQINFQDTNTVGTDTEIEENRIIRITTLFNSPES